jgi:hypothetical protein
MAFDSEYARNAAFAEAIVNPQAMAAAIEFITEHMEPADVFPEEKLSAWAKLRGWTEPPEEE